MQNGDVDSRDFYFNRAYAAVSACLAISGFAIFAISAGYERASESLIALRFAAIIVSSAVALTLCAITWVFIYRPYVRFFAGRIEVLANSLGHISVEHELIKRITISKEGCFFQCSTGDVWIYFRRLGRSRYSDFLAQIKQINLPVDIQIMPECIR